MKLPTSVYFVSGKFYDLLFEKQAFIFGVTTMEEAMSSFLHLCYVLKTTRRRYSSY
jgi:hypothetical protein